MKILFDVGGAFRLDREPSFQRREQLREILSIQSTIKKMRNGRRVRSTTLL